MAKEFKSIRHTLTDQQLIQSLVWLIDHRTEMNNTAEEILARIRYILAERFGVKE